MKDTPFIRSKLLEQKHPVSFCKAASAVFMAPVLEPAASTLFRYKEFLKLQYRIIPEIGKLMRHIPEELRRASVFKILFYHYYSFDLDQPFLPQYELNNRSLLHELRQLACLD